MTRDDYATAIGDEAISPRLSRTAEGFLIARDATFARCGQQEYRAEEVPTVQADGNGWVVINRDEAEVFDPASLATYTGKPVVLLHPDAEVHSGNVRALQIGTILNARRGEGDFADCVVGDLMFYDQHAIDLILRGSHRSLSAGYDAEYTQGGAGIADQRGIRINHLALLPSGTARCGDRCAVRDSSNSSKTRETANMRTRDQATGNLEGGAAVRADYRASFGSRGERTEMGDPDIDSTAAGPRVVMFLPGPVTAYSIGEHAGRACVLVHSDVDDVLDPGKTTGERGLSSLMNDARKVARARVEREQAAGRAMADSVSAFWQQQGQQDKQARRG